MTDALEIFRVVAAEFSAVDDAAVNMWLSLTAPLVSRKRFGAVYGQALALLTAHRMKTAAAESEPGAGGGGAGGIGGIGAAFNIASYASGGESVSFNSGALTSKTDADAEYTQTAYGVQYLSLRKLRAIPILSAGEA